MIVGASRASRDATTRGTRGRERECSREKMGWREGGGKGAEGKRERRPLCEKNQVPRVYVFQKGGSLVAQRGPRALSERKGGRRGEEGGREREIAAIRERLPNGPRLL